MPKKNRTVPHVGAKKPRTAVRSTYVNSAPGRKPLMTPIKNSGSKAQQKSNAQLKAKPMHPFPTSKGSRELLPSLLLVGEGNFTHALSILRLYYSQHSAGHLITATGYDSDAEASQKYAELESVLDELRIGGVEVVAGVDAGDLKRGLGKPKQRSVERQKENFAQDEEEWTGFRDENSTEKAAAEDQVGNEGEDSEEGKEIEEDWSEEGNEDADVKYEPWNRHSNDQNTGQTSAHEDTIKRHRRQRRQRQYDRIIFNFPHVGGKSTDVNRQVRANQELLVRFFRSAVSLLSPPPYPGRTAGPDGSAGGGQIIVTLFEGQPYSLWNIRDLARHCELRVIRSYQFPWATYPGYSHARTIGDIRGKNTLVRIPEHAGQGEERRGWRGEEREARSFVFEVEVKKRQRSDDGPHQNRGRDGGEKQRRKNGDSSHKNSS